MKPNHRVSREYGQTRVALHFAGDWPSREAYPAAPVQVARMEGQDGPLGRSIPYFEWSIPALRVLHETIGAFLGLKEPAAQVVEVRIVHEAAPTVARVDGPAPDPERAELEHIKAGMMKGSR